MTSKEKMLKLMPMAVCAKDKSNRSSTKGRYIIFDDQTNPCFREGHKSAAKAWKDLLKRYIEGKERIIKYEPEFADRFKAIGE